MKRRGWNRGTVRKRIRKRDGDNCHWCGEPMEFVMIPGTYSPRFATIEHIVPLNAGGTDDFSNIALAHCECNYARNQEQAA